MRVPALPAAVEEAHANTSGGATTSGGQRSARTPRKVRKVPEVQHRWVREAACLPRDNLELDFSDKVLEFVRRRRAYREAEAHGGAPGEDGCLRAASTTLGSGTASASSSVNCSAGLSAWASLEARPDTAQREHLPGLPASPTIFESTRESGVGWDWPENGGRRSFSSTVTSKFLATACLPKVYAESQTKRFASPPLSSRACGARSRSPLSAAEKQEPPVNVVESSKRLHVGKEEEDGTDMVPANTWLVLDQPLSAQRGIIRLSVAAGGGFVSESDGQFLRQVAALRLNATAADANLRRVARGHSLLGLRHAALAMSIFGQEAMQPSLDLLNALPLSPVIRSAPLCTVEESHARAKRFATLVSQQAAAAEKRAEVMRQAEALAKSKADEAQEEKGAPKIAGKSTMQKGCRALAEFRDFTNRRFGNPLRTWFLLDPEANMKLGEKQFQRKCMEMGFRGNVTAMWKYVDADGSGTIGLLELAPKASRLLAGFKHLVMEHFGDSAEEAFRFFDAKRKRRVDKSEFVSALDELGFEGDSDKLFKLMDRQGMKNLSWDDFSWIDIWEVPTYLFCEPGEELFKALRDRLLEMSEESPLKAWRRSMDKDGTMRTSWDEFRSMCSDILAHADDKTYHALPKSERDVGEAWRVLDADCCGWIGLREWDVPSYEAITEFKHWADRVHGGVVTAFRVLDNSALTGQSNSKLSFGELRKAARGPDPCKADLDCLFDGLDVHNNGSLTESDVKFLDTWDLAWDEWEAAAKHKGTWQG